MRRLRDDLDAVDRFAEAMRARVYARHGNPHGLRDGEMGIDGGELVDIALAMMMLHAGFETAEMQPGEPGRMPMGMCTVPVPHLGIVR